MSISPAAVGTCSARHVIPVLSMPTKNTAKCSLTGLKKTIRINPSTFLKKEVIGKVLYDVDLKGIG